MEKGRKGKEVKSGSRAGSGLIGTRVVSLSMVRPGEA